MYNISVIEAAVSKRIGFKEEQGIELEPETVSIKTDPSKSINKRHSLLKLSNIDKIKPKDQSLSLFLSEILQRAVYDTMMTVFTEKRLTETVKTVLENVQGLYNLGPNMGTPYQVMTDFVGFRIAPVGQNYVTLRLKKLGVALLNPQTELPVHIFHSSDFTRPFKTITLEVNKSNAMSWVTLDEEIALDFFNKELDRGGYYYIVIKSEDLAPGNQIIKRKYDWNKVICGSCAVLDKAYYDSWKKFAKFAPIEGSVSDTGGLAEIVKVNDTTSGINMSFTAECDITEFLLENIHVLDEAVLLQASCLLLDEMVNSTEINRIAGLSADKAYLALHGEFSVNGRERISEGLKTRRDAQIKALSLDISQLDAVCLKENKKRSPRWG